MAKSTTESDAGGASVRSVDRSIALLKAFTADKPSMSVLEIQARVGLSRPTVYRLLETLAAHGFIRAHGTPQRFSLDYAIGALAHVWMASLNPVQAGRPVAERLHRETRETVGLFVVRGHQHVCVLELVSPHVLSMSRGIGPMQRLVPGASGKTILAFMEPGDIDAVLKELPRGIDRAAVLADLARIRKDGFWVARSEVFSGAVGIAAPYFDHADRIAGSIIVYGPDVRFGEAQIAGTTRLVVEGAADISAVMGEAAGRTPDAATRSRGVKHSAPAPKRWGRR
jgi:IclR family transcriptional regulator, acetate operon repressor